MGEKLSELLRRQQGEVRCLGKLPYATKSEASYAANGVRVRVGGMGRTKSYWCDDCQAWHWGNVRSKGRPSRDARKEGR